MHETIQAICSALSEIQNFAQQQANASNPDNTLINQRGWSHPAITPNDVVQIIEDLRIKIEQANIESIESLDNEKVNIIPERIRSLHPNIQYVLNGNAHQALPAFLATLDWIEKTFDPILGPQNLENPLIPAKLKKRLNKIHNDIDTLEIETNELENIISQIKNAHETAENLPTEIAELNKARKAVEKALNKIEGMAEEAEAKSKTIKEQSNMAEKLLADSQDTYSISVTKGLAGAFQKRAFWLSISIGFWVCGLLAALGFGFRLGGERLKTLSETLTLDNSNTEALVIQLVLSLISLGAPIWFAWLSTKQIGQNFRLAEDYNFKASVAKAYEGYRREAARIDPAMEAQLLYSAIDRLSEAPLRYVEDDYHATPLQELLASKEFRKVLDTVPEFKSTVIKILNKRLPEKIQEQVGFK